MQRHEVEHVLRAASKITNDKVFFVFGSQSIHGEVESPPQDLTKSLEVDIYPVRGREESMELINGNIGELSAFQQTHGYYAHGIPPETCVLPEGWNRRLHVIDSPNTEGAQGYCLSVGDLLASKLSAGREKDMEFVKAAIDHGLCKRALLRERVNELPMQYRSQALQNLTICTRGPAREAKDSGGIDI